MAMRIGHGYDVHKFEPGRELVIGGVNILFEMGLAGHSDADVLIHAVIDSLLGAAALGDIGAHFPSDDQSYKNISSLKLLAHVVDLIKEQRFRVCNIDATVIAQSPKLAPYIPEMRKNLAKTICVCEENISIKATTEEGLGFTGSLLGIAAHCVVLIEKIEKQ